MSDLQQRNKTLYRQDNGVGVPRWVREIGFPTWASDPDGTICFFNKQAEELFELSATRCVGVPCHRVIAGQGVNGCPSCAPNCSLAQRVRSGRHIGVVDMRIGGAGETERWLRVLHVSITHPRPKACCLVHIAVANAREQRMMRYLTQVASRTASDRDPGSFSSKGSPLTTRQHEILVRLAEDESINGIANSLHISRHTVRNCIQHILTKLDVHSSQEAVARFLLDGDSTRQAGSLNELPDLPSPPIVAQLNDSLEVPSGLQAAEPNAGNETPGTVRPATPRDHFESRASIARALSHPTRLTLLEALEDRAMCICELTGLVAADQSAVSRHMACLHRAALVDKRKDGAFTYYRRTCRGLGQIMAEFDRLSSPGPRNEQP